MKQQFWSVATFDLLWDMYSSSISLGALPVGRAFLPSYFEYAKARKQRVDLMYDKARSLTEDPASWDDDERKLPHEVSEVIRQTKVQAGGELSIRSSAFFFCCRCTIRSPSTSTHSSCYRMGGK